MGGGILSTKCANGSVSKMTSVNAILAGGEGWLRLWVVTSSKASSRRPPKAVGSMSGPISFSIPAAFTVFPGEIYQPPRRWAERGYSNLSYFREAEKGGHFAAWEEPLLFASEMRAAFASIRKA